MAVQWPPMTDQESSHPQQDRSLWQALLGARADRQRRWRAHLDLCAEQLAEQGSQTVQTGLRLWAASLHAGWTLGRQWQGATLETWRRSLDLLR